MFRKENNKVLAVYLTLGDILPHIRSNTDHMQLVLLCREQDFKFFGHDLVMGQLVKDLKDIEVSGIQLSSGEIRKAIVCAIAGDNLGSHAIGGFVENFSISSFFCRFCKIDRPTFVADPLAKGPSRTVICTIKKESNLDLSHYNVCQPGLPPCIGHDLF